jgi:FtsH-binding integral membrane protein
MTHMRYWAMSLATAVCGGFIAIERFAFAPANAVWIAFGVAIAATVFSLTAFVLALLREDHAFSGLSALSALLGAWTIIVMRTFSQRSALWLAFAAGVILVLVSLRALALHETTIERVVHALEPVEPARPGARAVPSSAGSAAERPSPARRLAISATMRSWMYWLAHMALALAGAVVVLLTYALSAPGHHHASPRWIAFGIGIATTCLAVSALLERSLAPDIGRNEGGMSGRLGAIGVTAAGAAVGGAMIVTMIVLSGSNARWVAFALGCAMTGVSLLAAVIHELTSERVRHELEIAQPAAAGRPEPTTTAPAA